MTIVLNGAPREIEDGTTIAALLDLLDRGQASMAVAVNLRVVPSAEFSERRLAPGDRVDIVTAVGGG